MTSDWKVRIGEGVFGGGFIALGLFIVIETMRMSTAVAGATVGPKMFPFIIAAGAIIIGLIVLRDAAFGEVPEDSGAELDWRAVAMLSAGLIVEILLLEKLGWIIAAAVMFVIGARAFGSRRPLVDAALGLALSGATFLIFSQALGLDLPGGILSGLIDAGG